MSPTEQAYLANKEQFSKKKQRYLRYRINQKLLQLQQLLPPSQSGLSNNEIEDIVDPDAKYRRRTSPNWWAQPGESNNNNE